MAQRQRHPPTRAAAAQSSGDGAKRPGRAKNPAAAQNPPLQVYTRVRAENPDKLVMLECKSRTCRPCKVCVVCFDGRHVSLHRSWLLPIARWRTGAPQRRRRLTPPLRTPTTNTHP